MSDKNDKLAYEGSCVICGFGKATPKVRFVSAHSRGTCWSCRSPCLACENGYQKIKILESGCEEMGLCFSCHDNKSKHANGEYFVK